MLPGFRILFALVVLSFAILIFGFGALALLRNAHQNLASQPTWQPAWRTPVEIANAQRDDRPQRSSETQTLALLRVDPPAPRPLSGTGSSPAALLTPSSDTPPADAPVQETRRDAAAANTAAEVKSHRPAETSAAANAPADDHPSTTVPLEPIAGDKTSEQATSPSPADDVPKLTASKSSGPPEAVQGSAAASRVVASDPGGAPPRAEAAEAASETAKAEPAAPKPEPPIELAALPDATTSSSETGQQAGQQQSANKPDAAELRAKRRARARLRARRLALARARAARLAQQQAATNSSFYNSTFTTTGSNANATNTVYSTPNATPFGPPRSP